MIRRDYILRQVQELAQVLARAVFLRTRREYEAAIREIGGALRKVNDGSGAEALSAEDWLTLCRRNEEITGPLMLAVAALVREQASALRELGRVPESDHARATALTLQLEAIIEATVPVTAELLDQAESDIGALPLEALPPAALARLFRYCEERGRFAAAEDALFDWIEKGDSAALAAGRDYYGRLRQLSEERLQAGGLSRDEVEQGLADLERRAARAG